MTHIQSCIDAQNIMRQQDQLTFILNNLYILPETGR